MKCTMMDSIPTTYLQLQIMSKKKIPIGANFVNFQRILAFIVIFCCKLFFRKTTVMTANLQYLLERVILINWEKLTNSMDHRKSLFIEYPMSMLILKTNAKMSPQIWLGKRQFEFSFPASENV